MSPLPTQVPPPSPGTPLSLPGAQLPPPETPVRGRTLRLLCMTFGKGEGRCLLQRRKSLETPRAIQSLSLCFPWATPATASLVPTSVLTGWAARCFPSSAGPSAPLSPVPPHCTPLNLKSPSPGFSRVPCPAVPHAPSLPGVPAGNCLVPSPGLWAVLGLAWGRALLTALSPL